MFSSRRLIFAKAVIILLGYGDTSIAAPLRVSFCQYLLRMDQAFFAGSRTHLGRTPEEFFSDHKAPEGQTRFVMLIGAPGSGKSSWAKAARKNGWAIVDNDGARMEALYELQSRGEFVTLSNGRREVADPKNPEHFFTREARNGLDRILERDLQSALTAGKPIVSDALNIAPTRARQIVPSRAAGYAIEGLVFESSGAVTNMANLRKRAKPGEFILPFDVVENRVRVKEFYSGEFVVDPEYTGPGIAVLPSVNVAMVFGIPTQYVDVRSALAELPTIDREALQSYINEDVFNHVEFVWTRDYSR